jgi:hypothetical protein
VNETGELRANDTDGFVLKAQPGKSQRRPLTSSGSKPIAQIGLPHMRSPKAPEPSHPSLNPNRPDQQPQHDILMPRLATALRGRDHANPALSMTLGLSAAMCRGLLIGVIAGGLLLVGGAEIAVAVSPSPSAQLCAADTQALTNFAEQGPTLTPTLRATVARLIVRYERHRGHCGFSVRIPTGGAGACAARRPSRTTATRRTRLRRPHRSQARREIAGIQRFATDAELARIAGSAPIPASSGSTIRHRLDRGGNRQINCALHRLALTKGLHDPDTAAYLTRKQAKGKTRREAIRSLKRHLARRVWHLLQPADTQPSPPPQPAVAIHCNTPYNSFSLT